MKRSIAYSAALLIAICLTPTAWAQSSADPAEWVPADALAYVGVTDITATWEDFQQTSGYRMMNDEIVKEAMPSMSMVATALEKIQARVAEALDVPVKDLKNPFTGPLAAYVRVPRGAAAEDAVAALIATIGDQTLMRRYYDNAVAKLKESADDHDAVSVDGTTIDVFTTEPKEEEEDEFADFDDDSDIDFNQPPDQIIEDVLDKSLSAESLPPSLALCLTDDRLIVANSADEARAALRADSRSDSLAETADYKALKGNLKRIGTVRMLFNLPQIIELAKAETDSSDADDLREMLQLVGAESLRSVVGHMRMGASSYDSKFEILFLMSGQRSGLAKMLSMDNRPTTPPAHVNADTGFYASINLNPPQIVNEVEKMIRQSNPDWADQMRAMLTSAPSPTGEGTLNYQQELIDHLQGPLAMGLSASRPLTPESVRMAIELGHRDQAALGRFLSKMVGFFTERDVRGTPVYDIALPLPGVMGNGIAVLTDRLVISASAAMDSIVGGSGGGLAQSNTWQRVARYVPEESWCVFYTDNRLLTQAAMDVAQSPELQAAAMSNMGVMMLQQMFAEMMDHFAEADETVAERILGYAAPSILTIATTPAGVQLTSVNLRPE